MLFSISPLGGTIKTSRVGSRLKEKQRIGNVLKMPFSVESVTETIERETYCDAVDVLKFDVSERDEPFVFVVFL